jgi:bis(5'-nucleosyl)-tetraphosphatase (symmetrical)
MGTYVIGDVQGCYAELLDLLERLHFSPLDDRLLFVGDLVNRGPHSLEVLRYVRGLGERAQVVLGNHDLHLLAVAAGFARARADDTLDSVLGADDRESLLEWLRERPLMIVTDRHVIVHAGLLPQWDVPAAAALAAEVSATLRGAQWREFLQSMYGGKPNQWNDSLAGADRLRVIVNAMTRMRFCTPQGAMDLATKGEAANAPPGYLPWYDVPQRRSTTHTIVFGHWSALGLYRGVGVTGIDSGCVWGGSLTALRLEDDLLFQAPCSSGREHPKRGR